jgi:hypothetical protein
MSRLRVVLIEHGYSSVEHERQIISTAGVNLSILNPCRCRRRFGFAGRRMASFSAGWKYRRP